MSEPERPPSRAPSLVDLLRRHVDLLVVALLCAVYLASFGLGSVIHAPVEIFAQDSAYLLQSLVDGERYRFNPQNHLLTHILAEGGHGVWSAVFGSDPMSAFRFLKLFAAAIGVGFLLCLRALLREQGLNPPRRAVLLLLGGTSVSAWFHFAGFETHAIGMPFIALFLLALWRITRPSDPEAGPPAPPRPRDRALLIASLAVLACARTDLWRFALLCGALALLPPFAVVRRALLRDVGIALLAGLLGTLVLGMLYFDGTPRDVASQLIERHDRKRLRPTLMRPENLSPERMFRMARAMGVYEILMPLATPAGVGGYFSRPLSNFTSDPLSLTALLGLLGVLLGTAGLSVRRAARGEPFHLALLASWLAGFFFFTFYNPHEPFLWILEPLPLVLAALADPMAAAPRRVWLALTCVAALVAIHNVRYFALALG